MRCPACGAEDTRVINSRPTAVGDAIRRRRLCEKCRARFTTMETIEQPTRWVVKRSGVRERFEPEKLRRGIEKACEKRPVSVEQMDSVAQWVELESFGPGTERETTTTTLGVNILRKLKEVDPVAYLRFASVYKQFRDLQDFDTEIKLLLKD